MSPGPVSDSYDPVFSTGANRADVERALKHLDERLKDVLGEPQYIVEVAQRLNEGIRGVTSRIRFGEYDLRLLRFAVRVLLEREEW